MLSKHQSAEFGSRRWTTDSLWLRVGAILGRLTLAVALAIIAMFCFVSLAEEVLEGETRYLDQAVLQYFQEHQVSPIRDLMWGISWVGGPNVQPVVIAIGVVVLTLFRRFWPDGLTLIVASVGGAGLMYLLKRLFHRPRPEVMFDHLGYSFPSGHTFFGLVVYCMLAYWLTRDAATHWKRWIWALAVLAAFLMGFSRIYLGEHYPSDVAAGFAIGLPWVWGCLALPTAFHRGGGDVASAERTTRNAATMSQLKAASVYLPELRRLASGLQRDARVPWPRRLALRALGIYLALPFDLIPDTVPILGAADDLILVGGVLGWVSKRVPHDLIREQWHADSDPILLLEQLRRTVNGAWNRVVD